MNGCPFESEVLKNPRGNWPESLAKHVAGCEECSAAAAVGPWLHRFGRMSDRHHQLPDPAVVWLKAQLLRNTAVAERVGKPMNAVQMAAYVVVGVAWAALVTWKWEALNAWFVGLNPSRWLSGTVAVEAAPALSSSFFLMVFMLASVTVILALHTVLAEE